MADKKYIKSKSVFVKQTKHQTINDGTIYQRDWITTGGVNKFLPKQTPIYNSGNFIITINSDNTPTLDYQFNDFEKINDSTDWTIEAINNSKKNEEDSEEAENQLRTNVYDLRRFAYYGSCSELIRSTINSILQNYPGELFLSNNTISILKPKTKNPDGTITEAKYEKLNVEGFQWIVENPFDINIHLADASNVDKPLRYFGSNGFKNYEIINGDSKKGNEVTNFSVTKFNNCANIGEEIATIKINDITIKYVKGVEKNYYLHNQGLNSNIHIRPKQEFIDYYFNNIDEFESVLLNRKSTPKFTAKFLTIDETDFGLKIKTEQFTFPKSSGGYNIGGTDNSFEQYVNRLISIAQKYDEGCFSDNLYRMMTHESLKNFDFTINKNVDEKLAHGNDIFKKVIRLFGREFDNFKSQIDAIKENYYLSYKELTEEQKNLLKDKLLTDGWDIVNILPFVKKSNEGNCFKFSIDNSSKWKPFANCYCYYYDKGIKTTVDCSKGNEIITQDGCIARIFKNYCTEKSFDANYINFEFMRRLRMNSRRILRHKGTITGIEMLLSLFNLRSKRMNDRLDEKVKEVIGDKYDYEITEKVITSYSNITDKSKIEKIKYYNSVKLYDYTQMDISDFAGLPIKPIYDKDGECISLEPFYDKEKAYDGNLYYQMFGGWLFYNSPVFDKDDCLSTNGYTSTITDIKIVADFSALLSMPSHNLYKGMIVKILNTNKAQAYCDNEVYDIYKDSNNKEYIKAKVFNKQIHIGKYSFNEINSKLSSNEEIVYSTEYMNDNTDIDIYLDLNSDIKSILTIKYDNTNKVKSEYRKFNPKEETNENIIENWDNLTDNEIKLINKIINYYEGNNPHGNILHYDNGKEFYERFRHIFKYPLEQDLFDKSCFGSEYAYLKDKPNIYDLGFVIGEPELIDSKIIINAKFETAIAESNKFEYLNTKEVVINFNKLFQRFSDDAFKKYFQAVLMHYLQQMLPSNCICTIINN